jgi:hypothetical protein
MRARRRGGIHLTWEQAALRWKARQGSSEGKARQGKARQGKALQLKDTDVLTHAMAQPEASLSLSLSARL